MAPYCSSDGNRKSWLWSTRPCKLARLLSSLTSLFQPPWLYCSFSMPHFPQDRLFHPACSYLPLYPVNSTQSSTLTSNTASSGRPHSQASVIHSHSTTGLVSRGCCDKWPQTWWLKTMHLSSYSSEGQRSGIKSRCAQRWCRLGALWGESFSCPFQHVAPSSTVEVHHSNLSFHSHGLLSDWPSCLPLIQTLRVASGLPK